MVIIRVASRLLQGLPDGDYSIDDPRLKGRGLHWVTQGWVEVVSGELPTEAQPETDDKPAKKKGAK